MFSFHVYVFNPDSKEGSVVVEDDQKSQDVAEKDSKTAKEDEKSQDDDKELTKEDDKDDTAMETEGEDKMDTTNKGEFGTTGSEEDVGDKEDEDRVKKCGEEEREKLFDAGKVEKDEKEESEIEEKMEIEKREEQNTDQMQSSKTGKSCREEDASEGDCKRGTNKSSDQGNDGGTDLKQTEKSQAKPDTAVPLPGSGDKKKDDIVASDTGDVEMKDCDSKDGDSNLEKEDKLDQIPDQTGSKQEKDVSKEKSTNLSTESKICTDKSGGKKAASCKDGKQGKSEDSKADVNTRSETPTKDEQDKAKEGQIEDPVDKLEDRMEVGKKDESNIGCRSSVIKYTGEIRRVSPETAVHQDQDSIKSEQDQEAVKKAEERGEMSGNKERIEDVKGDDVADVEKEKVNKDDGKDEDSQQGNKDGENKDDSKGGKLDDAKGPKQTNVTINSLEKKGSAEDKKDKDENDKDSGKETRDRHAEDDIDKKAEDKKNSHKEVDSDGTCKPDSSETKQEAVVKHQKAVDNSGRGKDCKDGKKSDAKDSSEEDMTSGKTSNTKELSEDSTVEKTEDEVHKDEDAKEEVGMESKKREVAGDSNEGTGESNQEAIGKDSSSECKDGEDGKGTKNIQDGGNKGREELKEEIKTHTTEMAVANISKDKDPDGFQEDKKSHDGGDGAEQQLQDVKMKEPSAKTSGDGDHKDQKDDGVRITKKIEEGDDDEVKAGMHQCSVHDGCK